VLGFGFGEEGGAESDERRAVEREGPLETNFCGAGRDGSGSGSGGIPAGFGSCDFGFGDSFLPTVFCFGFGFRIGFGFEFGFSPVNIQWIYEINHLE
jgi:hypothetical protein